MAAWKAGGTRRSAGKKAAQTKRNKKEEAARRAAVTMLYKAKTGSAYISRIRGLAAPTNAYHIQIGDVTDRAGSARRVPLCQGGSVGSRKSRISDGWVAGL